VPFGPGVETTATGTELHYFAFGDCGDNHNPGHCNADLVSLALVQAILGKSEADTSVYMMRGLAYDDSENFAGSRDSPLFPLWEALSESVYTRKEVS